MINIIYVPGTFGSTIEYILRSHTKEYKIEPSSTLEDGSMHGFVPHAHLMDKTHFEEYFNNPHDHNDVVTISWPFPNSNIEYILNFIIQYSEIGTKNIIIYCDNFEFAEQNLLFQYHKMAVGQVINDGLEIFVNGDIHDFTRWNANYKTWKDLQPWEFREWFSIFYPNFLKNWISVPKVGSEFLVVSGKDILHNTVTTLLKIIKFCNLTIDRDLDSFVKEWQTRQQYILREYQTVCTIVNCTIKKQPYTWNNLNIIAESIVQQQLRQHGFELKCDGLNVFPTNSLDLHALLEPNWRIE